MAVAAGLAKADSARVTLTVSIIRRAGSVAVNIVIDMPNAALANAAVSSLSQNKVNELLTAAGLPVATVTSAAAVTVPAGSLSASGMRCRPISGLIFKFAMASCVAIGLIGTVGNAVCGN
jgi:hypothetical protein